MKWVLCPIGILVLWILLFWSLDWTVLVTGVIFACIVATLLGDIYPDAMPKVLNPLRWLYFLVYVPYFLYYCVRANVDVMLRVIHPDVPIRPGIVKVQTTLTSDMARTLATAVMGACLIAILLITLLFRPPKPIPPGHCTRCGYDLTGNRSGLCPECGSPIPPSPMKPAEDAESEEDR